MKWNKAAWMLFSISLGCAAGAGAQSEKSVSPSSIIRLQRDPTYEQNLKYLGGVDTAITPDRVLRWMNSLIGQTPSGTPSNVEFQPVLQVHDSQKQIIAQIAYKF